MKNKDILKLAIFAGEIMLKNGAETYRVEDTICRILSSTNVSLCESFVTPTGIFATIETREDQNPITLVRRVKSRSINMQKIHQVNDLSRRFVEKKIPLEDAYIQLESIEKLSKYPKYVHVLSTGLAAAFFSLMFQGTLYDFASSFLIGITLDFMILFFEKYTVSKFMVDILGGMLVASLAILLTQLRIGSQVDKIIIGSIMPLVPGVAITNAIRDTIAGDLVSGISRGVEAFIIAISIAAGAGIILRIWFGLLGGI